MFGRERFFLIVLVSIVVRLAVEGALFPRLVSQATWAFSIGLVVVYRISSVTPRSCSDGSCANAISYKTL